MNLFSDLNIGYQFCFVQRLQTCDFYNTIQSFLQEVLLFSDLNAKWWQCAELEGNSIPPYQQEWILYQSHIHVWSQEWLVSCKHNTFDG